MFFIQMALCVDMVYFDCRCHEPVNRHTAWSVFRGTMAATTMVLDIVTWHESYHCLTNRMVQTIWASIAINIVVLLFACGSCVRSKYYHHSFWAAFTNCLFHIIAIFAVMDDVATCIMPAIGWLFILMLVLFLFGGVMFDTACYCAMDHNKEKQRLLPDPSLITVVDLRSTTL
jgi:uncharacterized membrane protein